MSEIRNSTDVYVGLGSNLGDRKNSISQATSMLSLISTELKSSRVYESTPKGFSNQPYFLNSVCKLTTILSPWVFLHRLKEFEVYLHRNRVFPNSPRSIDLDILIWGNSIVRSKILTLPHPRIQERLFILEPLSEIAPDLVHPVLNMNVSELICKLKKDEPRELCIPIGIPYE